MIDWQRVTELREEVGEDAFSEIVAMFLEEVEEVLDRLSEAPDPGRLEQDLHFLKGSSLNLGFRGMSELCASGEARAASGGADGVDVEPIRQSYVEARSQLLERYPAGS